MEEVKVKKDVNDIISEKQEEAKKRLEISNENKKMFYDYHNNKCKFKNLLSKDVLNFIADIAFKPNCDAESTRLLFRTGYCYYFAVMLKDAFNRGKVCAAYPISHFVWVDDNGIPYDIEGIYEGSAEDYIPIEYFNIEDYLGFKQLKDNDSVCSRERLDEIYRNYLNDLKKEE